MFRHSDLYDYVSDWAGPVTVLPVAVPDTAPVVNQKRDPSPTDRMRLLGAIAEAKEQGCSDLETVRRSSAGVFPPLDVFVVLAALNETGGDLPRRVGRVMYARPTPGFPLVGRYVIYDAFADGQESFADQEDTDVKWAEYVPSWEERRAARLLLRLGWSSDRQNVVPHHNRGFRPESVLRAQPAG